MRMPDFDLAEPGSVAEACIMLAEDPEGSVVLAGGTDILVYLKAGEKRHRRLVSLQRIAGLGEIVLRDDGDLVIGATTTVNAVARHPGVLARFPGIVEAARSLAAEQVRNQATVVGNLCMAVPSADMAPILLAHDAVLRVSSPAGERTLPLRELFVGPRTTALGPADVVTAVEVPPAVAGSGDASLRQGGRASLSLAVAAVAALVEMEGRTCRRAAVALGSVAPVPLLAAEAGAALAGREPTAEVLREAGELASQAARPISDLRGTKEHRLELVRVLTRRVLATAVARAGGAA